MGIGSLAGALLAARRDRPRVAIILAGGFGFAFFAAIQAIMPTFPLFVIVAPLIGFTSLTMMTAANATMQTTTEPAMRGRVMALYMMVFQGAAPIGSPVIGWVGSWLGPRWAIAVGAVAAAAVCAVAALWARKAWNRHVHTHLRWPYVEVIREDDGVAQA
jgi:MFS family permease